MEGSRFDEWFFGLPPELMSALGTVLGFALLGGLSAGQQNALGNFLMLAAQILETSASQEQLLQGQEQSRRLDRMQRSLDELRSELDGLKTLFTPPPLQ